MLSSSEALSKSEIRDNLAIYGMQSLGGSISKYNWLEQANVVAKTLLKNVKIPKNAVIYNDRFFAPGRKSFSNVKFNPYRVFSLSPTLANAVGPDKWNPADIWIMTSSGETDLSSFNQKVQRAEVYNINAINNFLQKKYDDNSIIPVSLKKINPAAPHFTLMNSKYFVEQLDISDQTNPPIIEFTEGNKDVKINFTVRTIRLNNPARNMMQSQDRMQKLNGTPVQGSEKHIRIKYNVNKQQLEVEYEQSRPMANRPTAKHGSIGKSSLTDIISKTSRQGIEKLNEIKKPFVDTTYALKMNDYFLSDKVAIDEDNKSLALSYLGQIWETIRAPDTFLSRPDKGPVRALLHMSYQSSSPSSFRASPIPREKSAFRRAIRLRASALCGISTSDPSNVPSSAFASVVSVTSAGSVTVTDCRLYGIGVLLSNILILLNLSSTG